MNTATNILKENGYTIIKDVMPIYYDNESNKHQPVMLEKMNTSKIYQRHSAHGFVILSANRSDESEETNISNTKELLQNIKQRGYSFSRVFDGYKDLDNNADSYEPSFIVYATAKSGERVDFDELEEFAIQICKKFKQDSVYVQRPGETPIYLDMNGEQVNSNSSKKMKFNDDRAEYFTTTKRKKAGNKRFRFENFHTESASIAEIRKRSAGGEVFLMPHIGKIH